LSITKSDGDLLLWRWR